MKAQITKNQHYVPQFLLKNFSVDRKKINIFNPNDNTVEFNRVIKKKFQKHFFYDTDNIIEDFLEKNIETPASKVISSIVQQGKFQISSDEKTVLLRFISSLLSRTPEALEQAKDTINSNLNQVVRELLKSNGLDEDATKDGKFTFNDSALISQLLLDGTRRHFALDDLDISFIYNKSSIDFYISDHPVFTYNWLHRNSSHPEATSIFARGFQVFLPLSYNLILCLYDPEIYRYGTRTKKIIEIGNENDINILNSFQMINASSNIGFRLSSSESNLRHLCKRYGSQRLYGYDTFVLSTDQSANEQKITHTITVRNQLKLKQMPSFINVRKSSKKYVSGISLRNPSLAKAYYELEHKDTAHPVRLQS